MWELIESCEADDSLLGLPLSLVVEIESFELLSESDVWSVCDVASVRLSASVWGECSVVVFGTVLPSGTLLEFGGLSSSTFLTLGGLFCGELLLYVVCVSHDIFAGARGFEGVVWRQDDVL